MKVLLEEGRATARDEDAMKSKWVARCLSLHREKLEKAEGKASTAGARRVTQDQTSIGSRAGEGEGDGEGEGEGERDGEGGESGSDEDGGGDASEEGSEVPEQAEKKFSGGFSLEQCVAAVRLKAREREEASQNRNPEASAGNGGAGME